MQQLKKNESKLRLIYLENQVLQYLSNFFYAFLLVCI